MHGDEKRWWDVIAVGCPQDVEPRRWSETLRAELAKLPPDDLVRFDHWMDAQTDRAYRHDLWEAASLIKGGASDDGFYYFRLWLLGMGKAVFEAALDNPDSLALAMNPNWDPHEAEMYGLPRRAWCQALNKPPFEEHPEYEAAYEALGKRGRPELQGEDLSGLSPTEFRRRFPRLSALYLTEDDE